MARCANGQNHALRYRKNGFDSDASGRAPLASGFRAQRARRGVDGSTAVTAARRGDFRMCGFCGVVSFCNGFLGFFETMAAPPTKDAVNAMLRGAEKGGETQRPSVALIVKCLP